MEQSKLGRDNHRNQTIRNAWQVYEAPGVQPVFLTKEQAISYAQSRASFRSGEIRILDSKGATDRVIPFADTDRSVVTERN